MAQAVLDGSTPFDDLLISTLLYGLLILLDGDNEAFFFPGVECAFLDSYCYAALSFIFAHQFHNIQNQPSQGKS